MAVVWKGVDPNSRISARDGRKQLEGYLSRPLTADDVTRLETQFGRKVSEDDEYSGGDWNTLLKWGSGLTGDSFEDFRAPVVDPQQNAVDTALAGAGVKTGPPPGPAVAPRSSFQWEDIPGAPERPLPGKFSYDEFQVPGMEGMYADPGYQARLKAANTALEASKAAKGMYRSGDTIHAIADLNQSLASQEYGNVFGRAKDTYGINRDNAGDIWDRELLLNDKAYEPKMAEWAARANQVAGRNVAGFAQEWDRERFNAEDQDRDSEIARDEKWRASDDAWRKEVYRNDDAFRKAVFGSDDDFRRERAKASDAWQIKMLDEERLRFLASLGR